MNIKFGTDNFYVRYLKRFLNSELKQSKALLGAFDKNDLNLLINYLNLPNVEDMFTVHKKIFEEFPELKLYFTAHMKDNRIIFSSKELNIEASNFITENLTYIKSFCESLGWKLSKVQEWLDTSKDLNNDNKINMEDISILNDIINGNKDNYNENILKKADINLDGKIDSKDLEELNNYVINNSISFEIKKSDRKNYFPNKDMLVFVNQFTGNFMYNYALRDILGSEDGLGPDDIPHPNTLDNLKIALFECKPGQKLTIAHNNPNVVHLIIGTSSAYLKQDLINFKLDNVQEIDLKSGEGFQYTCPSIANGLGYDAHWLCIQCPSDFGHLVGEKTYTKTIEMGDINCDGEVNLQDYHLLAAYTAEGPGSEQYHWTPTSRQLAAMDLNHDGKIDMKDTKMFEDFLHGKIMSLGPGTYTYTEQAEYDDLLNVSNLLIIDGHYDRSVNIPFNEFIQDDWVIHEKFFNYLLGMAVHKYSDSTNITYVQELLKIYYPEYNYQKDFFYPGRFDTNMQKVLSSYQKSKISYFEGDLDNDGKLTKNDLALMRAYLDDPQHKLWIEDPTLNEDSNLLNDTQKLKVDTNKDGYKDELDYELLQKEVNGESDLLKIYDISFILGWLDVQTEALLEEDYNIFGNISEVSK